MRGRCALVHRKSDRVCERPERLRPADRPEPGRAVSDRARLHGDRSRGAHGRARRAALRAGQALRAGIEHGQAARGGSLVAGGRHVPADPRRIRLRRGVRRRAQVPRDAAVPDRTDLDQSRPLLSRRARAAPSALVLRYVQRGRVDPKTSDSHRGESMLKVALRTAGLAAAFISVTVQAQDYPSRAVRMLVPNVLIVHPDIPVKSVKELIEYARANRATINMSSAGVGSQSHLSGVLLMSMADFESLIVPHKGGGPSVNSVVAGQTHWTFTPAPAVMSFVKNGRVRAIGHSLPRRAETLGDIPPVANTLKVIKAAQLQPD